MKLSRRRRQVGNIPLLELAPYPQRNQALKLLILYHGWQSNKELNFTLAKKLSYLGYRVVVPDAINHGERFVKKSPIPSFTFWQSIQGNLFEFSYLLAYYHKHHLIADNNIAVAGVSMGGMTTCALLTHHPEIKVAACIMGTPDLLAYRKRLKDHIQQAGLHLPQDYDYLTTWVPNYDLASQAEKLDQRPILFWHGQSDWRVPYALVADFVAKHPDQKIHFIPENTGHLVTIATMDKIQTFFKEHF